jgi:hypothetical protein
MDFTEAQKAQTRRQWNVLTQQRNSALDQIVVLYGIIASLEEQLRGFQPQPPGSTPIESVAPIHQNGAER